MFHALLFAASSHIDVLRNEHDNPVTHYHRSSAMRLVLSSISSGKSIPLTVIAATTFLWHYEVSNTAANPLLLNYITDNAKEYA